MEIKWSIFQQWERRQVNSAVHEHVVLQQTGRYCSTDYPQRENENNKVKCGIRDLGKLSVHPEADFISK